MKPSGLVTNNSHRLSYVVKLQDTRTNNFFDETGSSLKRMELKERNVFPFD